MSRKATRRAERSASLRRRILAGATTAILGLGLAVGGVTPAMAKAGSTDPVPSPGTPTGQTTYEGQGGVVCDSDFVGFTKPTELDSPNLDADGTYTADWGSLTWNAGTRTVSWVINAGWDVDVCVKGGTTLTTIDTSEFDGSSYVHTYAGLSHAGFFATPVPVVDCVEMSYETGRPLNGADHINVDVVYNGVSGQINLEINENQAQDPSSTSGFHAYLKFAAAFGIADVKVPISQEDLDSGILVFEYGQYFTGTWTIEWAQFNSTYFNQDRDEAQFVTCGGTPEPVQPTAAPTPENCLEGDGTITFGDVDGIASYSVAGIEGTFAPGATLSGLSADTYTVTATVEENRELAADSSPFDVEVTSSTANCAEATAAVATTDPSCFSGETLNESAFSVSEGVTWSVIDDGDTSGSYEVLFTAPAGSLFSNGTSTLTATGALAPVLPDEECVLPLTNASLAFTDATCVEPQALDVDNFVFDDTLAQLSGDPVVDGDGNYTVVFTAIGENTTFDQSPDADRPGRTVSDSGKTLTFTGTLDGPNVELCEELPVVNDPFEYVDNCLTASYTLYYVEGLTYTVTVNSGEPFVVVFDENETQKTFPANQGDYVMAVPSAEPGYVLGPNQPVPLDRTFSTYPDGCQLPEFPNWPASATATDEACTPFGITSGSITVQFSTGPETNPDPVRYYLAYGTEQEQELTSATTTLPAGDYVVTAVLTEPTDSINDSGSDPVSFPLTIGAASESDCDLPTLAITGATNAVTGVGIGAVIIILAGLGFVLRRQLVE